MAMAAIGRAKPKIYILKNPVDTGSTRPETDPTNWLEVTGAVETTGHVFNPLGQNGPGGTINFDLSTIPAAQRTGWGWAIGGVDGNHDARRWRQFRFGHRSLGHRHVDSRVRSK